MKKKIVWGLLLYVVLSGGTWVSSQQIRTYKVNVASFLTPGFFQLGNGAAVDPSRAIQFAAQSWAANAGAAFIFDQTGSTSLTDCNFWGETVVVGAPVVPGDPNCNFTAGVNSCQGNGQAMYISSCSGLTLGMPSHSPGACSANAGCRDFHLIVSHEFGHIVNPLGNGVLEGSQYLHHLEPWSNQDDPFLMSSGASSNSYTTELFEGFGSKDVEAVTGPYPADIWSYGAMDKSLSSAVGVGFPTLTGFSAPVATSRKIGIGFDFHRGVAFGTDRSLVANSNLASATHESRSFELFGSGFANSSSMSRHLSEPALVHDTLRNQWWMIVRDANHNNYPHLLKGFQAGSEVGWVDQGNIPDIITRFAVGATYDALTDQIVVVWHQGRGDTMEIPILDQPLGVPNFPCTVRALHTSGGTQGFGCRGEYLVTFLRASDGVRVGTSRFILNSNPNIHGITGLGPPSVVCEADIPYGGFPQCSAFAVSRTPTREIFSWRFQPIAGGFLGAYTSPNAVGGQTDFRIAATSRLVNGTSKTVLSVTGSLDRRVYFRQRACSSCVWNAWVSPWSNKVVTAPIVRASTTASNYLLLVGFE